MAALGGDPLSSPPPSPQIAGGGPTGQSPFALAGGSGSGPIPSDKMPPEVLTGVLQSAETIGQMLDSFAQVAPDKAAQFAMIKDQLQQVLASLVVAGAGPTSPTAVGSAPPMGGIDRGLSGPGGV